MINFIKVDNLFGTFFYTLEFNLQNGVTIIHGPNGSGKSTILKMISSLSNKEFKMFFEVPFNKIVFGIENTEFEIERISDGSILKFKDGSNEFVLDKDKYIATNYYDGHENDINRELHKLGAIRLGVSTYEYKDKTYSRQELYEMLVEEKEKIDFPEWFNILDSLNVRYIGANRLEISNSLRLKKYASKVESFQDNLISIFQEYETKYGIVSRALDDSFPNRIIDLANSQYDIKLDEKTLTDRLSQLSLLKSEFTERGILVQKDTEQFLTKEISSDQIKDNITLKKFLQLFIEDNEKKFAVFNALIKNIKIFESIFKRVFRGKKVEVSRKSGFEVIMTDGFMKGDSIPVNSLSSGEQHYLVLFYELIFNTQKNQLILIDEPELSLHVSWLIDMVDQFLDIAYLNGTKFILATHSSAIMRNHKYLCKEVGYPD